jgi:arabinogalactan endo-1,4-beta-galactosidase
MKVSQAFPSEFIKAADLNGQNARVTMARVEMKDIGDDQKPVLYFKGKEKGLVLNKTNSNNIAILYGDEMDEWLGQEIILFEAMVDFQGKTVPAIRVRGPQPKDRSTAPARQPQTAPKRMAESDAGGADMDDAIPF